MTGYAVVVRYQWTLNLEKVPVVYLMPVRNKRK